MKIAIIGRTQILYETALKLHEKGHKIACIITAKASPEYSRDENDFKELAKEINAPYLCSNTLNKPEVEDLCKDLDIAVSINWVSIIKQKQIEMFRLGILNAHLGDLPKYRGNACPNWAIINNEASITNSIHFMEGDKLDCGRVICQDHFKMNINTTITDIYKWSEASIPMMFLNALKELDIHEDYILKFADPNSTGSFRCYPRLPEDGFINWDQPVMSIHNLIRAVCHPFPGAYCYHWDKGTVKKLIVLKSRIVQPNTTDLAIPGHVLENNSETGESFVKCKDGIIALLTCKYDNEQEEFSPGKRWKSIRIRLGVRVEDWIWEIQKSKKEQLYSR